MGSMTLTQTEREREMSSMTMLRGGMAPFTDNVSSAKSSAIIL